MTKIKIIELRIICNPKSVKQITPSELHELKLYNGSSLLLTMVMIGQTSGRGTKRCTFLNIFGRSKSKVNIKNIANTVITMNPYIGIIVFLVY